jgi:exonuclease SbcC
VLLTRIYLRNFRVFEDELDLEVPPGLVGIFGPNGAGKSTLLESITWTLWGKARTSKEEIRSAGVGGDCITELTFEHEGHLYVVRRTLAGASATVRAQAHCDGLIMSEGVRDTGRYIHSVLGVDDAAFRASVFAEQKQLAAFSDQTPSERRKLVLQLLGIMPLDAARDAARRDAKARAEQHQHLRRVLPDLEAYRVALDDAEARAGAAEALAATEEQAAATALARAAAAAATFARLDVVRQEYDGLVIEGRAARAELDTMVSSAARLQDELTSLSGVSAELASLRPRADGLESTQRRLPLLDAALAAGHTAAALQVPEEPPPPDTAGYELLSMRAESLRAEQAGAEADLRAAHAAVGAAQDQLERSAVLSEAGECPLCGQELGEAFAAVQAHRHAELDAAQVHLADATATAASATAAARSAGTQLQAARAALEAARAAHEAWVRAAERHADARSRWERALADLGVEDADLAAAALDPVEGDKARAALAARLEDQRAAAAAVQRLQGRLERRPQVESELIETEERVAAAQAKVAALLDKVRALNYDKAALDAASQAAEQADRAARAADGAARTARLTATQERTRAEGEALRLADARAQHDQLATLETDSRHLARVAELLNAFRNTVVASVGPRLAVQAAELFAELTDNEYDQLEVDPETYELQISDAGRSYGLDRFSGSEVDLANLALRVAISEHVRFQSGGSVGLLVLDEIFGPLDEERKARMLDALDRLRGRFRQILVVTHASDIKEQLPHAIEVIKRPGRRATARVLNT